MTPTFHSPWPATARFARQLNESRAKHAGPATQQARSRANESFALADASALGGRVKPGHGEVWS